MNIVFVCTGNSCRSVIAEYLLNKMSKDKALKWEARSCGTAAERYFPTPEGVKVALRERGIENFKHTPQLAGRELLGWADVVLAMTRGHRDHLIDDYPEFTDKTHLFTEYCADEVTDVPDPIGKPTAVYQKCRDDIEDALKSLLEKHAS
jgi:protein-tyrosine phosphatase